jgi:hypothetical protein
MNENSNGSKWVNTELKGELVQEFALVKKYHGIGNNVDVVRFLIRKEARRITALIASSIPVAQPLSHEEA